MKFWRFFEYTVIIFITPIQMLSAHVEAVCVTFSLSVKNLCFLPTKHDYVFLMIPTIDSRFCLT